MTSNIDDAAIVDAIVDVVDVGTVDISVDIPVDISVDISVDTDAIVSRSV